MLKLGSYGRRRLEHWQKGSGTSRSPGTLKPQSYWRQRQRLGHWLKDLGMRGSPETLKLQHYRREFRRWMRKWCRAVKVTQ